MLCQKRPLAHEWPHRVEDARATPQHVSGVDTVRGHEGMDLCQVEGPQDPTAMHDPSGVRLVAEDGRRVAEVCPPNSKTDRAPLEAAKVPCWSDAMPCCVGDWLAMSGA